MNMLPKETVDCLMQTFDSIAKKSNDLKIETMKMDEDDLNTGLR